MLKARNLLMTAAALLLSTQLASALDAEVKAKIDAKLDGIKALASSEAVVAAVKAHNTSEPAESKDMTQDKWKGLSVLDPFVRSLTKNAASGYLKEKKDAAVSEAFLSAADGKKVAFLTKPSNWSHSGKAKHDKPMAGETWYGEIEVDDSTGAQQVQIGVPVLDGGKPIGSLVVGLAVAKL